jgi:hypothetical protein
MLQSLAVYYRASCFFLVVVTFGITTELLVRCTQLDLTALVVAGAVHLHENSHIHDNSDPNLITSDGDLDNCPYSLKKLV